LGLIVSRINRGTVEGRKGGVGFAWKKHWDIKKKKRRIKTGLHAAGKTRCVNRRGTGPKGLKGVKRRNKGKVCR